MYMMKRGGMKKIVILGGGISGLSAAYLIKEEAKRQNLDLDVKLVEKEQYVGGKVRSNPVDGYLCEWGPNGFLANKPQTLKLCEELGIIGNLMPSNDNACKRWVYSNNKLHKLPHSQKEFFTNSLLSFTGKLRIMAEIFVAKRTDTTDETLADFARRRLGTEALNKWITPMAGGIFAGDPETMSLKACFPRIYELEGEYRSLIKGMVKLAKRIKQQQSDGEVVENSGALGGKLTSFAGGLQELTDCLASKLGMETIITGKAIKSITKIEGGQYQIASDDFAIDADVIISALPAYAASKIIARMDSELSLQLKKIKYAPLIVACFGYDRSKIEADLNGFGYLLAKDEAIPILGSLWDSSIFMHRRAKYYLERCLVVR
jgi:oxygen-dependent protoporphyrinogen oxidase